MSAGDMHTPIFFEHAGDVNIPGIYCITGINSGLLRWNKTFEFITGKLDGALLHQLPADYTDARDKDSFEAFLQLALAEGIAQTEARLLAPGGVSTPFSFTGLRTQYEGQPAILLTGIDISAQKRAAEEMRQSGERYFLTTRATNDMIWDWNLITNEIWWNYNYNVLFGYGTENTLHHISSWMEGIHPDDKERVIKGIYKVINSGEKYWTDEYRYLKDDGTILYMNDRGYITHDEKGKPYRMIGSMLDITERIKAEAAIREKEERYRNLFERAGDSIIVHDQQGNILDVNFAASTYSGYSAEEMKRMKVSDLLFAEDLAANPIPFDQLLAGATTFNRRRVKTRSGVVRIMEVSSKLLPDNTIMAMIRDVTERSENEKALRTSELRFRTLAGNVPEGIFETDANGDTVYVNEKLLEYTGRSFDEMLRTHWIDCVHPDDREQLVALWKLDLVQKKESSQEYRLQAKDGATLWVKGKAVPVYDKNGQFNGYLGTVTDITKEKLAQIALARSEEKYRTLVEQASDAIYIVDENGNIVTVNPAAGKLSGYTEAELVKMNIMDFVFAEDLLTNPLRIDELKKGKTVTVQRRLRIKNDKELDVECLANMLSDGRILVFARDISERLRIQNEIIKEKNLSASIINSLPGIFYLYDEQGQFLRWNKNFEFVSGYQSHEIEKMKAGDFFDEDEKEAVLRKVEEVFTRGMADTEAHFFTKDKRKIPYYFSGWRVIVDGKVCLIGVGIDITEKRKAEEELLRSRNDIRRLASHLNRVREEERKRIGREIHDELGQQLTAIKMDMAWIDKKTEEENTTIKTKIHNVISLLDSSNRSVRRILMELGPGVNDEKGLPEALERQNRLFTETTGMVIAFDQPATPVIIPQETANTLFRIYQESLTNIIRHAQAGKVVTSLKVTAGQAELIIKDDGRGFDNRHSPSGNSFGIIGMKERVLEQKGTFSLQSAAGKGTTITVRIPLPPAETKLSE